MQIYVLNIEFIISVSYSVCATKLTITIKKSITTEKLVKQPNCKLIQIPGETIRQFATRLRRAAKD